MSIWAALAGGFVGTLILTTVLRAGSELHLTRMDLPFLLGTMFTRDRKLAKLIGFAAHFLFGLLFALVYYGVFRAVGHDGWLLGGAFGFIHGTFSATALVTVMLPVVHPRMGDPFTAAGSTPLIEQPGFLMLNYGRSTPVVSFVGHILYGAIVGGFIALAA